MPLDKKQKLALAVRIVRSMMSNASSERIRRIEWWSRAQSALKTAAQSTDNFGSFISKMASKLEIDVTTIASGQEIVALGNELGDDVDTVDDWLRFCDEQAVYIVAEVQAASQERRAQRERQAKHIDDFMVNPTED